ncbi:MAG TPA: S24 family peptidase [Ignavibacteria bacterium]|nr:S24 family peptidase [Ignavibacteria bacterium]
MSEFAKVLGTVHQNIQRYETGTKPQPEFFEAARKRLGLNVNWFFDDKAEMYEKDAPGEIIDRYGKNFRRVSELAMADCGLPAAQWERSEKDFIIVDGLRHYKFVFAVKAVGDSMKPYIEKNDHVVCAEVPFENIKDHTAVLLQWKSGPGTTEASVKLFQRQKTNSENIVVYSVNTKYHPEEVPLSRVHKIYKVVKIIRDVA